jgi:hypothetical protein
MPRELNQTVQINLRIKERERRQLEAAAESNGVSLNAEMAARIARTFRQEEQDEAARSAENLSYLLKPLVDDLHELAKAGDLIRAADELETIILANSPVGAATAAAIGRYRTVKRMIEIEAGIRLRKMTTSVGPSS